MHYVRGYEVDGHARIKRVGLNGECIIIFFKMFLVSLVVA